MGPQRNRRCWAWSRSKPRGIRGLYYLDERCLKQSSQSCVWGCQKSQLSPALYDQSSHHCVHQTGREGLADSPDWPCSLIWWTHIPVKALFPPLLVQPSKVKCIFVMSCEIQLHRLEKGSVLVHNMLFHWFVILVQSRFGKGLAALIIARKPLFQTLEVDGCFPLPSSLLYLETLGHRSPQSHWQPVEAHSPPGTGDFVWRTVGRSRRRTLDYALLVVSMTSTTLFQMIGSSASRIGDIVLTPSGDLVLMTVRHTHMIRSGFFRFLTSISVFVYPTGFSFRSLEGFWRFGSLFQSMPS